jgi:hypothetical protein
MATLKWAQLFNTTDVIKLHHMSFMYCIVKEVNIFWEFDLYFISASDQLLYEIFNFYNNGVIDTTATKYKA